MDSLNLTSQSYASTLNLILGLLQKLGATTVLGFSPTIFFAIFHAASKFGAVLIPIARNAPGLLVPAIITAPALFKEYSFS